MIHKTLLIALFGCVCLIQASLALHDIEAKWSEWKKQHGKEYSVKENIHRRMLFEKKVNEIEKHNSEFAKGLHSYKKGLNKFSDLTFDEFKQTVLNAQIPKNFEPTAEHKVSKRATLPTSVDWRNEGLVTPVKNQGICGSCWAFSTVGAIEGQYYKLTKTLKQFSEQQLVDCVANNGGCNGGWTGYAFDYVRANGIEEGTVYPYTNARLATAGTCQFDARKISDVKVNGYVVIAYDQENEAALDDAIANVGPISVLVYVSENFQSYSSGIFYDDSWAGEEVNHAVLAVGYGTENGQDYYMIKNSWDTWWGEQGYIRIARNKNGHIGIGSWTTYPLVSINA